MAEVGAVSAALLAFFADQIHQFILQHEAEKFIGFRGQFFVHLGAIGNNPVRITLRHSVSVAEIQALIVILQLLQTQAACLAFLQLP
ncbi:hypothetical protein D3C76_204500 [compost metagenome]